jgi:hypothetical protein
MSAIHDRVLLRTVLVANRWLRICVICGTTKNEMDRERNDNVVSPSSRLEWKYWLNLMRASYSRMMWLHESFRDFQKKFLAYIHCACMEADVHIVSGVGFYHLQEYETAIGTVLCVHCASRAPNYNVRFPDNHGGEAKSCQMNYIRLE